MLINNTFKSAGAMALLSVMPLSAAIIFTEDSTSSLVGSFEFDVAGGNLGEGLEIANFRYFLNDFIDNNGYSPGDSQFYVDEQSASTIALYGDDLVFVNQSAVENYDPTGLPGSYPDRSGTFTSLFDGVTEISYSYTNVGFIDTSTLAGNFSFSTVPEPSSSVMLAAGLGLMVIRRKRY